MAQNFFDTGFGPASASTTGAPGSTGGRDLQFGNLLVPDETFNTSTGAPGSTPGGSLLDPGHGDVTATDPFGHLNGSNAPGLTGTTATSWQTGTAALGGEVNWTATGAGEGSATNGSQRITHGD